MAVQDMYTPSIQQTSLGDKLSDSFLGTNKRDTINNRNRYEYQKAVNINKYNWNKQGMIQAGINPLVASGSLGSMSSSQAGSDQDSNTGLLGEVLDMLDPVKQMREAREFAKDLLTSAAGNGNLTKHYFG